MTLPTSRTNTVGGRYDLVVQNAAHVRAQCQFIRQQLTRPITTYELVQFHMILREARAFGEGLIGDQELVDYAAAELGEPAYDISQAFVGVVAAGAAVTQWIEQNLPGLPGGVYVFTLNGEDFADTVMQPSETAPLYALVGDLLAAIGDGA